MYAQIMLMQPLSVLSSDSRKEKWNLESTETSSRGERVREKEREGGREAGREVAR